MTGIEGWLTRWGKIAGSVLALLAIAGLIVRVASDGWGGSESDPTTSIEIDGDVVESCVFIGQDNICIVEQPEDLTTSQEAWLDLPLFDDPPPEWRTAETWSEIAETVFGGRDTFDMAPSQQLESGSATRTEAGFVLEFSDTETVTAFIDETWPGPWEPPFYVAITATQLGGPIDSRACGLLFNAKYGVDYSVPNNRWFIVKVAGGDVQVTQWTDRDVEGNIDHRRFESFEDVVAPNAEALIEVLVEEDGWTAAVNGRVVSERATSLGPNFAFPAGQQETTLRRGNVVCDFSSWAVRTP